MEIVILTLIIVIIALGIYINKKIRVDDGDRLSKDICMNYANQEPSTLEIKLVEEMVCGYKKNQLDFIEKKTDTEDARAIWFSLEKLKGFIYHIEANVRDNDPSISNENLGVHVYYSRYPSKNTWDVDFKRDLNNLLGNPITEKYEHLHTLIMVPTLSTDESSINIDFNPSDTETYRNGLKGIHSLNKDYQMFAFGGIGVEDLEVISAQNHGSLFPPDNTNELTFG